MKTRWYLTVESETENLKEFTEEFVKGESFYIPTHCVVGAVMEVKSVEA